MPSGLCIQAQIDLTCLVVAGKLMPLVQAGETRISDYSLKKLAVTMYQNFVHTSRRLSAYGRLARSNNLKAVRSWLEAMWPNGPPSRAAVAKMANDFRKPFEEKVLEKVRLVDAGASDGECDYKENFNLMCDIVEVAFDDVNAYIGTCMHADPSDLDDSHMKLANEFRQFVELFVSKTLHRDELKNTVLKITSPTVDPVNDVDDVVLLGQALQMLSSFPNGDLLEMKSAIDKCNVLEQCCELATSTATLQGIDGLRKWAELYSAYNGGLSDNGSSPKVHTAAVSESLLRDLEAFAKCRVDLVSLFEAFVKKLITTMDETTSDRVLMVAAELDTANKLPPRDICNGAVRWDILCFTSSEAKSTRFRRPSNGSPRFDKAAS